ncbi:MAG TPA: hypothetical protein VM099_13550 [Gemmatimonadaceae bacterium]|nr:hypothetical protein [Gemmatimonadaceae bacterium]
MVKAAGISRLMTFAVVLAILACTDSTSPDNAAEPTVAAPAPSAPAGGPLQTIGESLVDATDWVFVAIADDGVRVKMKSAIKQLADDLVAGRNSDAKRDVSALRANLASLQDLAPALGPIGVALDQIDSEFAKLAE